MKAVTGFWIVAGVVIGVVLGSLMGNVPAGIVAGIGIAIAMGLALNSRPKTTSPEDHPSKPSEPKTR